VCTVFNDVIPYSSVNMTSPFAASPPENSSDCTGALVTRDLPNTDSQNENCLPSESDRPEADTSQSAASCDAASSANATSTTGWRMENSMPSADSALDPCAPIVAVGGAKEEELKQGLEQRLGLVLSKLARESDDDDQRWSVHITSDHVVEDSVVDESVSDAELTDTSDVCHDIQHILLMDVVQEMDEVERYSYISFVAYAMHQLFEYSAWNEYVMFFLLTVYVDIFFKPGIFMLLIVYFVTLFLLAFQFVLNVLVFNIITVC